MKKKMAIRSMCCEIVYSLCRIERDRVNVGIEPISEPVV